MIDVEPKKQPFYKYIFVFILFVILNFLCQFIVFFKILPSFLTKFSDINLILNGIISGVILFFLFTSLYNYFNKLNLKKVMPYLYIFVVLKTPGGIRQFFYPYPLNKVLLYEFIIPIIFYCFATFISVIACRSYYRQSIRWSDTEINHKE